MRKSFFKKALAVMSVTTLLLGMSTNIFAADDEVVMADAAKTYTSGAGYAYAGFVSTGLESASDYRYLVISYKGDAAGFTGFRFDTCKVVDEVESNKTGAFWFKDMADVPAATADVQTAVIDLTALPGINMDFNSFHLHTGGDAAWTGTFEITEFKLTKTIPQETTTAPSTDDVVIADAAKTYTSGAGYAYAGFVSTGLESASDYRYLVISYKGDAAGFTGFRFDTCKVVDEVESNKTGAFWFKDMADVPAATADVQTAVIDLTALAGINMDFNSFHLHTGGDAAWTGTFEITEFKLTKTAPQVETTTAAQETTTAADEETTTAASEETTAAAGEETTAAAGGTEATTGSGAGAAGTGSPSTGDSSVVPAMLITLVAGAAVVAASVGFKKANSAE